jgi:transcriptional regulator with XRE-family HTH domain
MTLSDVCKKVGIAKGYLSGIETSSVAPPSPEVTMVLSAELGLPPKPMILLGHIQKLDLDYDLVDVIRADLLERIEG